jgi:hypothetical protein
MRLLRFTFVTVASLLVLSGLHAQDASSISSRLVGRPLYLRGMWADNWLEFNGDGTLHGKGKAGPLTESGVDVLSVKQAGDNKLEIVADRIIFGWSPDGVLMRSTISTSNTVINLIGSKLDTFRGHYQIRVIVRADADGSFDRALHAIFAESLEDLTPSAPKPWTCWASAYFVAHPDLETAQQTVDACIQKKSLAHILRPAPNGPTFTPPQLIGGLTLPFAAQGVRMHASGEDEIAFTVSTHGLAVGFQIRRALGRGMDEAVLQALAEAKFMPATENGQPVLADMNYVANLRALTQ